MALVALVALMATLLLVGEIWKVTLVHLAVQDQGKVFLAGQDFLFVEYNNPHLGGHIRY